MSDNLKKMRKNELIDIIKGMRKERERMQEQIEDYDEASACISCQHCHDLAFDNYAYYCSYGDVTLRGIENERVVPEWCPLKTKQKEDETEQLFSPFTIRDIKDAVVAFMTEHFSHEPYAMEVGYEQLVSMRSDVSAFLSTGLINVSNLRTEVQDELGLSSIRVWGRPCWALYAVKGSKPQQSIVWTKGAVI